MPNWIAPTVANIEDALQAPEVEALREAVLGDSQADPVGTAIASVVPRVRGFVASRPGNRLDQDQTLVPPELFQDTVWLVIQALKARLGYGTPFTDDQKTLLRRAEDDLKKVATGNLRVSPPQNPETVALIQSGSDAELVAGRTRLFGDQYGVAGSQESNTLDGAGITDGVSTNGHYIDPPWLVSFPWQWLSGKPTTVVGSGITDAVSTAALAGYLTSAAAASTYAPLNAPDFTGIPLAPTAAAGNSTRQIATTAFVRGEVAAVVASASAALDTLAEIASALGNDPNFAATVSSALALKAPLANPTFTGSITLPNWTTAGRPAAPVAGMIGWNSTLSRFDHYTGGSGWKNFVRLDGDTMTGPMTIASGTAATAVSPLTITQTWNGSGIVFPGVVLDFTDTLSSANSLMLDMRVGGASKAAFDKAGNLTLFGATGLTINNASGANFQAVLGGISLSTATASGISFWTNNVSRWSVNGTSGHLIPSASATYDLGSSVSASRVRNGYFSSSVKITGAASALEVWNTDAAVSTTNYEKFFIDWTTSANVATIGTVKGGTGTARVLSIVSASDITFTANGAGPKISAANGNLQPNSSSNPALTSNFICITATSGAPTGTPGGALGNSVPVHFDTSSKKLYVWDTASSTWKSTPALT